MLKKYRNRDQSFMCKSESKLKKTAKGIKSFAPEKQSLERRGIREDTAFCFWVVGRGQPYSLNEPIKLCMCYLVQIRIKIISKANGGINRWGANTF